MAVDARGSGEAVLFVHGLGGSMNSWTPLLPAMGSWRCVRPELPGAGRSNKAYALGEATAHRGKISAATHAEALARVCASLGIAQAHVVGHSFGTLIAQHLAVEHPQLVRSLVLYGALAEPAQAARDALKLRAQQAREQGVVGIAESVSEFSLSASTRQQQPVTVAYVRDSIASQCPEGYARNCEALAEARSARLELIGCPTLIVNGDEDPVTPLQGARALADKLNRARIESLSRCGHWPMLERPAESQRALREFLLSVR